MDHDQNDVVIVAAARTPQGRSRGSSPFIAPSSVPWPSVEPLSRAPRTRGHDAVIVGQVLAAGSGQNAARQAGHRRGHRAGTSLRTP